MLDDITKMEIQVLAKWIINENIPTQGPHIAARLLKVAQIMREKAQVHRQEDEDVVKLIEHYADCYQIVGMIEGITAGGVIDLLRELIEKEKQ